MFWWERYEHWLLARRRLFDEMIDARSGKYLLAIVSARRLRIVLATCLLTCVFLSGCHKKHSVMLSWEASPDSPGVHVIGYNVYRSANAGQQFDKIASRVTATNYEDPVEGGRSYVYAVTAVERGGRESRFSTQVRVTIP
jgi:hypothetical protein